MSEAVYRIKAGRIFAGELARGPWDERAQHGGAPAALIVRALEQMATESGPALARVTFELLRPVPVGELSLGVEPIRVGRRTALHEATLRDAGGREVLRARALRVQRSHADMDIAATGPDACAAHAPAEQMPPPPEHAAPSAPLLVGVRPMFAHDAIEIRFVQGSWESPGPATAWFRMRVPLVAGETPSPLQRLAAVADFPNGIASALDWKRYTFINPDLTLYIEREPLGEWICLRAHTRIPRQGVALAEAELLDHHGRVGRCFQSLLIAAR